MTTVRNFDRFVLRPLHLIFIAAAIALLIGRFWLLLAGAVFGIFYMGTIGAKLHSHQSFLISQAVQRQVPLHRKKTLACRPYSSAFISGAQHYPTANRSVTPGI